MTEKRIDTTVSDALAGDEAVDFDVDSMDLPSSGEFIDVRPDTGRDVPESALPEETSPIFKELAHPKLPELPKENRARLLMQSPTRIFFYWSLGKNPYQLLHRLFGQNAAGYTLVVKLIDVATEAEEVHPVEAEGSWWFNVRPDAEYRAEIGLYSTSRPFIRILFSNTVATPRKRPSPRSADTAEWSVSGRKFAEVLDASGFSEDAFDVALGGERVVASDTVPQEIFAQVTGTERREIERIESEELRLALMALAAGVPLEALKWKVSSELYALLQVHFEKLRGSAALASLGESLDLKEEDLEFEYIEDKAVGGSLVNFPRRVRHRRQFGKYKPVSSLNVG
ncbi:MAG TPA: DUF4912 domain-containing protein [Pyrinomonadaceae bacterium]|nr:DUF4912 domain-containing protein [Pyrinomonadaceae bacterium]